MYVYKNVGMNMYVGMGKLILYIVLMCTPCVHTASMSEPILQALPERLPVLAVFLLVVTKCLEIAM